MKKILIVEDNRDNMALLEAILEDHYKIAATCDSGETVTLSEREKPDLILLDISLPRMDGTQVLHQIRNNERVKAIPVIAITAHAMKGDREKFMKLGFNGYISKPIIDDREVLGLMEECLGEKKV